MNSSDLGSYDPLSRCVDAIALALATTCDKRAILADWLGLVATAHTGEMARRRTTRGGSLAVWRSGATAAVMFLCVCAGGAMPASARFQGDVHGAIAAFGTAAEGKADTSAAHHDDHVSARQQERVAARQLERVEERARERQIAEKTPESEKAAQAETPQQPAAQRPAQKPAVETAATVAMSPNEAPKEAAGVVVSKEDAEAYAWRAKNPEARKAQIQNEVDALVNDVAAAATMPVDADKPASSAEAAIEAAIVARPATMAPVEPEPVAAEKPEPVAAKKPEPVAAEEPETGASEEPKLAETSASEEAPTVTNAEIEAIRERLEEATEAAEKAHVEEAKTHQKLLDFRAAHAAAVEDAAASARADGVAVGVKLGMRKADARARREKARDAKEVDTRVAAMEANVAAALADVSAAEEAAAAASRVTAFAETRAEALVAMLRAKKPARRWQSARKWEDADASFVTGKDASGALGQRMNASDDLDVAAVWVTAQIPTNSGKRDLRERLLPELVEIASWGSAGIAEDDFALVRSHFVLIGGLILPHPAAGHTGQTALLDINLLCRGIAADLRVLAEEVHCYRNGTTSVSPPVSDLEGARDASDTGDYAAAASYERALETRALAETVANASRVASARTDPASDATAAAAETSRGELSAEDTSTGAFTRFAKSAGVSELGATWDPNVPRDGDYTFDERSLPAASAAVEGEVVVFILTGQRDQSDFMDLVARVDLHQYASAAEFTTTQAMTGGRVPVLQFARHHARLTYAVAVADEARRAAVMARFRDPAAQKYLSAAMGGRSLLRDVKVKKQPRVAFDTETGAHVDANVTETRTRAIWNDPLSAAMSAVSATGAPAGGGGSRVARDAETARDVWATFRVPFVAAEKYVVLLRDRLFLAMVTIAQVHGETGVVADDVAFVRSKFVFSGALAVPAHSLVAVGVDGACAALAADLAVDGDALDCFMNGTVAVPAGSTTNEHVGNHTWSALAFAVHGLTSERRFAEIVARLAAANETHELSLPAVAATCGGNTPALLSHEQHAFVTYAVAVADRAEADTVMGALKSEEAAQLTARVLRVDNGAGAAIRDVMYKMAPRGAKRGDENVPESVWANPNVSPPPPPAPPAPSAPDAPPAPFVAPEGAPRRVLVTVAAPTNAVSSPNATTAAEKSREAREALARAADTSDEQPFWNGLVDVKRDVELDLLEFNFVAELLVAGDEAVDIDLLCDAIAVDLGARTETSRCALVSTSELGEPQDEKHSPEWEAKAEQLRWDRAKFRRHLRRRRQRQERRESAAAADANADLGHSESQGMRLVFSAREVPDRAALDAMTAAGAATDFPTASAVCGGRAVTLEYAHSRAEMTFAVWTTSQQVAATVRAAVTTDAFIEEFGFELGGECELRDARVDQLREPGGENAEAELGRPAALLGRAAKDESAKRVRRKRSSSSRARPEAPLEVWATVQTPLLDGRDPHDIARELAPALDEATARVRGEGERKGSSSRKTASAAASAAPLTPSARYVGASYVVMSSVLLPGFPVRLEGAAATLGVPESARQLGNEGVVSMAQACAAIAVDLGVRAEDAECRFNGTAALGASFSAQASSSGERNTRTSSIGQSVVMLADVGANLARARAAVERARPGRAGAFSTTTAVVGGDVSDENVGAAAAQYARTEAFFAFAIPVADEAARVMVRAALSTKAVDAALAEVTGARAVARASEKVPSPADVAALDPAPASDVLAAHSQGNAFARPAHPEPDATVFMRDDPVFERDVPGEKGRQGALGGVSRIDETRNEEAKAAAELALRQAKARTAKAQLLALHRMSPRLADLGDAGSTARGESGCLKRRYAKRFAVSSVVLAAAALVAADARRRALATGDAAEREPLVRKDSAV